MRLFTPARLTTIAAAFSLAGLLTAASVRSRYPPDPVPTVVVMIVFGHFLVVMTTSLWLWLAPRTLDLAYVIMILGIMASYVVNRGECMFNYWERRLSDPGYVVGSDPSFEPYMHDLPKPWVGLLVLLWLLKAYVMFTVFSSVTGSRFAGAAVVAVFYALTLHFHIPSQLVVVQRALV